MDKYTRISNEMLEAIYSADLSKAQNKALIYIIRKTIGWNKDVDCISVKRMAEETGQQRRTMLKAVNDLEKMNIISVNRSAGHAGKITLEPVSKWTPVSKSTHVSKTTHGGVGFSTQVGVYKTTQGGVSKTTHTKDISKDISKDNIKYSALSDRNPWDEEDTPEELEAWLNS
jgi:phage replication O-like protein O